MTSKNSAFGGWPPTSFELKSKLMTATLMIRLALTLLTTALLASCGGGGGGGVGGTTTISSTTTTTQSTGFASLPAAATLAARCAAPRSGASPVTAAPYPDRLGSLLNEQNWLAAWTNDLYLWYREVPYPTPTNYSTTGSYFKVLKTSQLSPSGAPKDRFHFSQDTAAWEAESSTDLQIGYGATWSLSNATPPRHALVAYTEPGTPATSLNPPLARGASILRVDGVDFVNDITQAGVAILNAALFPVSAGESHTFVVQDPGSSTTRNITMVSALFNSTPVQNVGTLAGGTVGYMLFNDHMASAESALINAFLQFQNAGVTDLVLDVRYNRGGYLTVANELAYMIAGPTRARGKTFEQLSFNDKHPNIDPVALTPNTPILFRSTAVGFGTTAAGTALPTLNLGRVFVLTGSDTCSASESVMNGLRGIGVEVIQIGATTCGKPYGFYPTDNCGTTYFSIQFKGVNAAGFGDYSDGFAPQNGATSGLPADAILPGCAVADDFTHALGDPAEARLAAALQYRTNGVCPTPASLSAARMAKAQSSMDGEVHKNLFLSNRILKR